MVGWVKVLGRYCMVELGSRDFDMVDDWCSDEEDLVAENGGRSGDGWFVVYAQ